MRTHQEIDARSLALHRLIADKIERDPLLFDRARVTLERWRKIVDRNSQPYLDEWEQLMARGQKACLAVATEDSEHATALRQSSPFAGVLTSRERFLFLRNWAKDHKREASRT